MRIINLLSILILSISCGKTNKTSKNRPPTSNHQEQNRQEIVKEKKKAPRAPYLLIGGDISVKLKLESRDKKTSALTLSHINDNNGDQNTTILGLTKENLKNQIYKKINFNLNGKNNNFSFNDLAEEENLFYQISNWDNPSYYEQLNYLQKVSPHDFKEYGNLKLNFHTFYKNFKNISSIRNISFDLYRFNKKTGNQIKVTQFVLTNNHINPKRIALKNIERESHKHKVSLSDIKREDIIALIKNHEQIVIKLRNFEYIKEDSSYNFKQSLQLAKSKRKRIILTTKNDLKFIYTHNDLDNIQDLLKDNNIDISYQDKQFIKSISINKKNYVNSMAPDTIQRSWLIFPQNILKKTQFLEQDTTIMSHVNLNELKNSLTTINSETFKKQVTDNLSLNNLSIGDEITFKITGYKNIPTGSKVLTKPLEYSCVHTTNPHPPIFSPNFCSSNRKSCHIAYTNLATKKEEIRFNINSPIYLSIEYVDQDNNYKKINLGSHNFSKGKIYIVDGGKVLFYKLKITKNILAFSNKLNLKVNKTRPKKMVKWGFSHFNDCRNRFVEYRKIYSVPASAKVVHKEYRQPLDTYNVEVTQYSKEK